LVTLGSPLAAFVALACSSGGGEAPDPGAVMATPTLEATNDMPAATASASPQSTNTGQPAANAGEPGTANAPQATATPSQPTSNTTQTVASRPSASAPNTAPLPQEPSAPVDTGAVDNGGSGGSSGGSGGSSGGSGGDTSLPGGSGPVDQGAAGAMDQGAGGTADPGTGDGPGPGEISIDDPVPGYASVSGGTTGGGTDLASAVTVSSMADLQRAVGGSGATVILVEPGDYSGTLSPGSNKTIIGLEPGVKINGNIMISGGDRSNLIIRNIAVQGNRCNSYDECKAGADGIYVGNGAHHVWLDHIDVADGQDGNLDITQGGDFVTVSWTHFHYTYDKEHRFSNLIAGSDDEPNSVGKLHITYMTSHWGERVDERQPRGRFGNIHMLNNYHNTGGSAIHGVGVDMALIAENCVYDENRSIWTDMGSPRGWKGIGNIGSASGLNDSRGTVFDIPYDYTAMPAEQVKDAVMSTECGAGNTCVLAR
jgi:pectate lyase